MNDQAFLKAIAEKPEDDLPRLVHADWLDEQGRPERAEFIRVQCRLARLDEGNRTRCELTLQERDLYAAGGVGEFFNPGCLRSPGLIDDACLDRLTACGLLCDDPVYGPYPHPLFSSGVLVPLEVEPLLRVLNRFRPSSTRRRCGARRRRVGQCWQYQRGYLHKLMLRESIFVPHAEELLDGMPTIREVKLHGYRDHGVRLTEVKCLDRLTGLDLSCRPNEQPELGYLVCMSLATAKSLGSLRRLDLTGLGIVVEGVPWLTTLSDLSRLSFLSLSGNPIGTKGLRLLSSAPAWDELTELNLSRTDLNGTSSVWVGLRPFARPASLYLAGNRLDTEGVKALVQSPCAPTLRALDLSGNHLGPEAAEALAESPLLNCLCVLRLRGNRIGRVGAAALAASPHFASLKLLDLRLNRIRRPATIAALRERFGATLLL